MILQLIEEGKLNLDDTVEELLPEQNVPLSSKITLHHLLLHVSGLPNEKGLFYQSLKKPNLFVSTVLAKGGKICKGFGQFNYANIDYVLLGLIIEKVEKKSWYSVLSERIINPLNLSNTGFLEREKYPEDFAYTFSFSNNKRLRDPEFYIENFYSSACMYTDTFDLLKLDQTLHGDTLLNQESKGLLYNLYPEYNYTGYSVWTYNYPFVKPVVKVMEKGEGGLWGPIILLSVC